MSILNLFTNEPTDILKRFFWATMIILAVFFALVARFWYLQIARGEHFRQLSENNRIRVLDIPPSRGIIFDRNGLMLVSSRPAFNLYVIPDDVQDWKVLKNRLSKLLDLEPDQLEQRYTDSRSGPLKPIPLKLDLSRDELGLLETYKYMLQGIYIEVSPQRDYPLGVVAPHTIGYLSEITQKQLKSGQYPQQRLGDMIGQWGLELQWQIDLGGIKGGRYLEVDALGQEIRPLYAKDSAAGNNIITTLDWKLQQAAQEGLKNRAGAVVALKPATGEILALASTPHFDPTTFSRRLSAQEWNALQNDPLKPLQNRSLQGQYPPGSTYKIVTALAALEEKVITPETSFYCNGALPFGNRVFHCWRKGGHGQVSLHKAIVQSCDVYFYQVGQRLGVDRLARYAQLFGLGRATGISLPHEKKGLIPTSAWKLNRFKVPWQPGETLSIAIGQGYDLVTPLQMAVLMAAVANGGTVYQPLLVKRLVSPQGTVLKELQPIVTSKAGLNSEALRLVRAGLSGVVNEPGGTGGACRLPGILAAGKTGTAQVVTLGKKALSGSSRDHAWFVAYAPVENPEIAVAVLVEHGGHGGEAAAPIARKLFEAHFSLPPRGAVPTKKIEEKGTEPVQEGGLLSD
ncbi:MAG: penicillin-binding protein 2 [Deltaproteobacteria bacterium]|nr:penicillin-binding protein 2 [Deltaproteobacteria bacterium]